LNLRETIKSTQSAKAGLKSRITRCQDRMKEIEDHQEVLELSFRKDLGDVGNCFEYLANSYKYVCSVT